MTLLSVPVERDDGLVRIAPAGELDISTAKRLEHVLEQELARDGGRLLLDLRGLEFMDSTGLRVILRAHGRAREAGRSLVIVRGAQKVNRVFEITGVDAELEFVDDPAAAG